MIDEEEMECPVCGILFSQQVIEEHASRCLFLHESSSLSNVSSPKREIPWAPMNAPLMKKSKQETSSSKEPLGKVGKIFASSDRTPSSFLQSSSRSPSNQKAATSSEPSKIKNKTNEHQPLAERMRPSDLDSYIGQTHILSPNSMLYELINKGEVPNFILWGPPGCGKTSLANVVSKVCKEKNKSLRFVKLSAAVAGVSDVKSCVSAAANEQKFGRKTVLFMDEIHRFNKMQQDIFLPHIESGTITMIGATTENPSFSLNSALLSRCRVIVMEKLSVPNLIKILSRAVAASQGEVVGDSQGASKEEDKLRFRIDGKTIEFLAETCDGDARIALGGLELAIQSKLPASTVTFHQPVSIALDDIKESLKKSHTLYDRKGDQHYDMVSALHKSVRAGDDNAALYWLARMMAGGEDPVYIARRLVRMASEDIGLADPHALGIAVHTMHACKMIGMPECDVPLAQCVVYLARAPKSRLMEDALRAAQRFVADYKGPQPGVPLHLRNAPTKLMKNLGYGKGYNLQSKEISGLTYMPEGLEDVNFLD